MNAGNSAAWEQQWDRAIAAYGRAVQEFPEDPDAHRSLGLALLMAHRLEEALKVYTRAHQLAPDDAIPLEKSADVLERMGRLREAAQQYIKVADIYIAQRDLEKAIGNWERATQLTPGLIQIHAKLATAYERTGESKKAIVQYLTLAFNFQRAGDTKRAIQAVHRAIRLEPGNPQALNALQALESGTQWQAPPSIVERTATQKPEAFDFRMEAAGAEVGESDPRGPLGEAEVAALSDLAIYVFESDNLDMGSALAIQAIELHRQHDIEGAIASYQQALEARFNHSAIHLSLGALLIQEGDSEAAIKHLNVAIQEAQYAAGANHGLGQAFMKLGKARDAALYLVETLRLVDLSLAISTDERAQLNATYDDLASSIHHSDEDQLVGMNERFFRLLTGTDWKQRVAETRRMFEESARKGRDKTDIGDIFGNEELIEATSRIDRYMREGYLTLAMDEAHYAVEIDPSNLPVHTLIAQILMADNRLAAAAEKYKVIADTYLVREQPDRAEAILTEVLQVAPMDLEVRARLIDLLEQNEQWADVLDQYIDMADAYYQMADFDMARDTYEDAFHLAQRLDVEADQIIRILHRMADIDVTRMDLRQALRTYEQIKAMRPDDERTRKALMDLNYRLNNRVEAMKELDELMRLYAKQRRSDLIQQVLEEQVAIYPDEMALRSRLAAFYSHIGRKEDAVRQLDALGELQLDAGLHNAAAETIRQIVTLNPPGVEDYKRLLRQLGG
ncbi:MAG: tetratricopeptide repeat protein [Anaerolineae bacterium]|nr:tetratricopeptide repeat protein [Anaerolineae bacterium]